MLPKRILRKIAKKLPELMNSFSPVEVFEIAHEVGIIRDKLYNLFKNNSRLKKNIPEFMEKFSKEVQKNAERYFTSGRIHS